MIKPKSIFILFIFYPFIGLSDSWLAAYPYEQEIEGQKVRLTSYSYDPYWRSPTVGLTSVYYKDKLLYQIDYYFREPVVTSDDGKYLVVVRTTNHLDMASSNNISYGRFNYDIPVIDIFENGILKKVFSLREVCDTAQLMHNNKFYNWGYFVDQESFDNAKYECKACLEVYGKKILKRGDTNEIVHQDLISCNSACDSMTLLEKYKFYEEHAQFIDDGKLYILTNLQTVVRLDLNDLELDILPFDEVVNEKFKPKRITKRFIDIEIPDKFIDQNLADGREFYEVLDGWFKSQELYAKYGDSLNLFISYIIFNKEGKCTKYYGYPYLENRVNRRENDPDFIRFKNLLEEWLFKQEFDTSFIPESFEGYAYTGFFL